MWAEWMDNFDLSITPEDIEKYNEMQKVKNGKLTKKRNPKEIVGNIVKTHKKSWFKKFNLDDYEANNYLGQHPILKYEDGLDYVIPHTHYEDIIVLQVLVYGNNKAIAEIVLKKDYDCKEN